MMQLSVKLSSEGVQSSFTESFSEAMLVGHFLFLTASLWVPQRSVLQHFFFFLHINELESTCMRDLFFHADGAA